MIYFQRAFRFLLAITVPLLLVMAIAFGVNSPASWAATVIQSTIDPSQIQLAKMDPWEIMNTNQEGNAEEVQTAAVKEAERFKAATLEGMNNSIVNPAYDPGGKTKKLQKQDNQDMKDIKNEANEMFD